MGLINTLKKPLLLYRKATSKGVYSPWDDPEMSYMKSPEMKERLYRELASVILPFLKENVGLTQLTYDWAMKTVVEFFDVYGNKPFQDNQGGASFNNSILLFFAVRAMKPSVIVESGVWKGMTTYIMHKANPEAKIFCFDVSFGKLQYRCPKAVYTEKDWGQYDFIGEDLSNSLAFFDCHINHALRIRQSYDNGFRRLIVDDNPPIHKMYSFGLPPIPTADMLYNEDLKEGDVIEWIWNGKEKSYTISEKELYGAKELISKYHVFPEVGSMSRYGVKRGTQSFLSYLELE
jgi:hypothetical protein